MKRIVLVLGLMLIGTPVFAQSAVASWDPVTLDILGGPETIAYYTLYYGTSSRPGNVIHPSDGSFAYDTLQDVGNVTQRQVDNLTNGVTYYFSVAAVDVGGNVSDYSAEVPYVVPTEDCNNLQDDDHDGLTDCQDAECSNQTEACDGFDNDCDGTPDNHLSAPPCAEQDGVCAGSTQSCGGAAGWRACDASSYGNDYEADEASCDGLDNDCDDSTDENLSGPACPLQLGVCSGSAQSCGGASGWQACDASSYGNDYEATEITCDGLDNDCDGTTDDDCPCNPGDTQPCSSNEGECEEGTQTCDANGNWGACDGVLPREEICDNLDNDCDTQTDEDLTGLPCPLQDGVCAGVAATCGGADGWVCDYGATYQETETLCDDLDNDCDGDTDEDCGETVVEGSCGCGAGTNGLALLPLFLLILVIRRR
jgi:hypothetical protein